MTEPTDALAALFTPTTFQRPQESIGFLLWRVAHRHQRNLDRALVDLDLTHLQFATLVATAWLRRSAEAVAQVRLAEFSRIHPMQLSSVLKALERKGFIVRQQSRIDARTKLVDVTPAGITALSGALPRVAALQDSFFGDCAPAVHSLLRRIAAADGDDD